METLHASLQHIIKEKFGFSYLTPIQQLVLKENCGLARDLLISSPTGSGKSLSYLIPIVGQVMEFKRSDGTFAIVISPTRELSVQLETISSCFTRKLPHFVPGAVLSGNSRQKEKARLRAGLSIVIGAPGRLMDHLESTSCWNLQKLKWVIIEEADRYLYDANAKQALIKLLSLIIGKCSRMQWNLILVSATLPKTISEIGGVNLNADTVHLSIQHEKPSKDAKFQAQRDNTNLYQWVSIVPTKYRLAALLSLLSKWRGGAENSHPLLTSSYSNPLNRPTFQAILFTSTCDTVEFLYSLFKNLKLELKEVKFSNSELPAYKILREDLKPNRKVSSVDNRAQAVISSKSTFSNANENQIETEDICFSKILNAKIFKLHGSQTSRQRSLVVSEFRKYSVSTSKLNHLLITTSVGARGLDFPDLQLVIQWDAPLDLTEYKHKIGRTARWQAKGASVLFLMPNEEEPVLAALFQEKKDSSELDLEEVIKPKHLVIDPSFNILSDTKSENVDLSVTKTGKDSSDTKLRKNTECFKWMSIVDETLYTSKEQGNRGKKNIITDELTLLDIAKKAFLASLRAYATYPMTLRRSGVHPKQLHLGHYAKSFGLREAPGELGSLSAIYGGHLANTKTKLEMLEADKKATFRAVSKRPLTNEFSAS